MGTVLLVTALLCLGGVSVRGLTNQEKAWLLTGAVGSGSLDIEQDPANSEVLLLRSRGMPNRTGGPSEGYHGSVMHQNHTYRIPKNPAVQAQSTCVPMGVIGLALNGAPILNPYTAECYDAGLLVKAAGLPNCTGQPHHYHITPRCIFNVSEVPSPIIGVALDGFPIYGPRDENGRELTSADLDGCHGRQVRGQYRYHVTRDFPYFLGCFKGAPVDERIRGWPCQCRERADPCQALDGSGGRGTPRGGMRGPPGGMGTPRGGMWGPPEVMGTPRVGMRQPPPNGMTRHPGGMPNGMTPRPGMRPPPNGRTPPPGGPTPPAGDGMPPDGMTRPGGMGPHPGRMVLDRDTLRRAGIVCPTTDPSGPVVNDREGRRGNSSGSKVRMPGVTLLFVVMISLSMMV